MTTNEIVQKITSDGRVATNEELEIQFAFFASEEGWTDEEIKYALQGEWFPWLKG